MRQNQDVQPPDGHPHPGGTHRPRAHRGGGCAAHRPALPGGRTGGPLLLERRYHIPSGRAILRWPSRPHHAGAIQLGHGRSQRGHRGRRGTTCRVERRGRENASGESPTTRGTATGVVSPGRSDQLALVREGGGGRTVIDPALVCTLASEAHPFEDRGASTHCVVGRSLAALTHHVCCNDARERNEPWPLPLTF